MNFDEIKKQLEVINSEIFMCSLQKNLTIEQLTHSYKRLLKLKESILNMSFKKIEIDELEQVRFCLLEEIYNIRILIRKKVGQDVTKELEKLELIYKNIEKTGGN